MSSRIKIRRNPDRSPLNLIKNKFTRSKYEEEKIETDYENEKNMDTETHEEVLQKVESIIDNDQKQFLLLRMIYLDDIDVDYAVKYLCISKKELISMVDILVEEGYLKFNTDNDAVITDFGIEYIKTRNKYYTN